MSMNSFYTSDSDAMIKFLNKILLFFLPFIILVLCIVIADPFKVFLKYDNYYADNQIINLNREYVSTQVYKKNPDKFNSFILGNSRSLSYKCTEWEKFLTPDSKAFHFDAYGETIAGILDKLQYLNRNHTKINNALIILDYEMMSKEKVRLGTMFHTPPEFSNESYAEFYYNYLKYSLHPKFMLGLLDYNLFHKQRSYMKILFIFSKYKNNYNPVNNEVSYGYEEDILHDSVNYYKNFEINDPYFEQYTKKYEFVKISDEEIRILNEISSILKSNKTEYKIVVSPLYDKIKLDDGRIKLLKDTFGEKNVYDFSGVNEITTEKTNFYESSHYRHKVANKIMETIYFEK